MKGEVMRIPLHPSSLIFHPSTFIPPYNPPFELPSGPFTGQWPLVKMGVQAWAGTDRLGFWRLCALNQSRQVWVLPLSRRFSGLPPSFTTPIC